MMGLGPIFWWSLGQKQRHSARPGRLQRAVGAALAGPDPAWHPRAHRMLGPERMYRAVGADALTRPVEGL